MSTLSVLMPHYNHGEFVEDALSRLLAQKRPADEVIVIDDASDDGSFERLEEIAGANPEIRLIRSPENVGPLQTAQRLLEMAAGDYVHFAAADDLTHPHLFSRSLDLLAQFPTAGLCSTLSLQVDAAGRSLGIFPTPVVSTRPAFLAPAEARAAWRLHGAWVMGNAAIWRREAFVRAGGFRQSLGPFADGFQGIALSLRHGACFIPEPLAAWRRLETGFAATRGGTPEGLRAMNAEASRLMRGEFADAFDEDSIRLWETRVEAEIRIEEQRPRLPDLHRLGFTLRHRLAIQKVLARRVYRWRLSRSGSDRWLQHG